MSERCSLRAGNATIDKEDDYLRGLQPFLQTMIATEIYEVHLSHLPRDQKADLVMRLLHDLEGGATTVELPPVSETWREAWTSEIKSRLDRLDRGETQLVDWEEAIAEIQDEASEGEIA